MSLFDDEMDGIDREAQRSRRLEARPDAFEGVVVRHLLKRLGLSHEAGRLRSLCYDQTGRDALLFTWFADAHPDFPAWLGAARHTLETIETYRAKLQLPAGKSGARPVAGTRMFRSLEDLRRNAPDGWDRPIGLVFRQYHRGRQLKIIHTADLPLSGWQERFQVATADGPETYTVEDFDTFLSGLRWSP